MPGIPLRSGGPAARIAVIPGDGIGAEVTPQAVKVLKAVAARTGRPLEFVDLDWSADKYLREGVSLPGGAVEMLRDEFDAILFGALGDPRVPSNQHAADILLGLRFKLDLYVNARPVELLHERLTPLRDRAEKDIRLMVFRENTEGLYVGVGGFFKKDTPDEIAVQEDVNSRKGVERIIRYAFEYARRNGLKRVCMSDKSNAMTFAHDLWQRVFKLVRQEYADIDSRHLYIDTLAMEIVRDPRQFDVIVTCNLFGDIISDLGAQLAGGLGLAPSGNIHPGKTSLCAVRKHTPGQDFTFRAGARLRPQHCRKGNRQSIGLRPRFRDDAGISWLEAGGRCAPHCSAGGSAGEPRDPRSRRRQTHS